MYMKAVALPLSARTEDNPIVGPIINDFSVIMYVSALDPNYYVNVFQTSTTFSDRSCSTTYRPSRRP